MSDSDNDNTRTYLPFPVNTKPGTEGEPCPHILGDVPLPYLDDPNWVINMRCTTMEIEDE